MLRFAVHSVDIKSRACACIYETNKFQHALTKARGSIKSQNRILIEDRNTGVHLIILNDGSVAPTTRMDFGEVIEEEKSFVQKAKEAISKVDLTRNEAIMIVAAGVVRGLIAWAVFRILAGPPPPKRQRS